MRMIYLQLYLSFLQVGLFSVGGGYAAMPLIRSQVVELHPWMTLQEFTNLITIAEMTPGPIAINCATFVGLRIAQLPGAVIATLGCITPALVLVSLLAWCYRRWPGSFGFAERAGLSATGGGCLDSGGRAFDFGDRGVPQRNLGAGQH